MELRTLKDLEVAGKRVIVRVDVNVPLANGVVADDTRIKASLPTLQYLRQQGSRIVLLAHLGRPKGVDPALSLKPIFTYLAERLPNVQFCPAIPGSPEAIERSAAIRPGDITLFENLRFHPGEASDDETFAKALAQMGEVYVNDAFADAHRKAASMHALAMLLPSAAGFQLAQEVQQLGALMQHPERPLVGIIGGAKISTKLTVIRALLEKVDYLLLGGALANTILKAQGVAVGTSLVEESMVEGVKDLTLTTNKLRVPIDVVMAPSTDPAAPTQTVAVANVPDDQKILDIGPETVELYKRILEKAKTIVWNGPMGYFELPQFAKGTSALAKIIADLPNVVSVAGGGETVDAINDDNLNAKFTFISTGGGAMLEFLEGKELPGITPLLKPE